MSDDSICVDVTDFRFKLASKVRVFHNEWPNLTKSPQNLVASASRLGLTFIGTPSGLQVARTSDLLHCGGEGSENYPRRHIPIEEVSNLTVNCDDSLLAVVAIRSGCPHALVFNTQHFLTEQSVLPQGQMVLGSQPGLGVAQLAWNPTIPGLLCVCLTDGSIATFEVKGPGNVVLINSLSSANGTCVSWSPRGKQLVVGGRDGSLAQFMPDLKPVKSLPVPGSLVQPAEAIAVAWLSSYQFAVVYKLGGSDENRLTLCVVNAPKQGPVTCIDFDDVCYSSGDLRPHQFYVLHQLAWNIVLCVSANGMEVGVLGQKAGAQQVPGWQQWTMEDSARAELPLEGTTETFPLGMALDLSSTQQIPWEESLLAPMPVLLLLSHRGMLCAYHVINMRPQAPTLCQVPLALPNAQHSLFSTPKPTQKPQQILQVPNPTFQATPPPPQQQQQVTPIQQPLAPPIQQPQRAPPVQPQASSFQATASQPISFQPAVSQPISFQASPAAGFQTKPVAVQPRVSPAPVKAPETVVEPPPKPVVEQPEEDLSNEAFAVTAASVLKQFNEEIQASLRHSQNLNVNEVGSPEDRASLYQGVVGLQEKVQTLQSEMREASEQIHTIKNLDMEVWRLFEDARTRINQRNLPGYAQVVCNRPLDPSTARKVQDIDRMMLYVDSQLEQAASGLDQTLGQNNSRSNLFRLPSKTALHRTLLHHRQILANLEGKVAIISATANSLGVSTSTAQVNSSTLDMSSMRDALNSVQVSTIPTTLSTPIPKASLRPLSRHFEKTLSTFLNNKPIAIAQRKPMPSLPPQYAFANTSNKIPTSTVTYQPKTSPISPVVVQPVATFQPAKEATQSFVGQSSSFAFKLPPTASTLPSSFVQMTPSTTASQFSVPPPNKASFITVSAPPAHGTPIVVSLFGSNASPATTTAPVTTPSFFSTPQNTGFNFGAAAQSAPTLNFSTTNKGTPIIFSQPLTGSEKPSSSIFASDKASVFGSTEPPKSTVLPKPESTSLFGSTTERLQSPVTSFFSSSGSIDKLVTQTETLPKTSFFTQVPPNTPNEVLDSSKPETQTSFFGNLEVAQKPIMSLSTSSTTPIFGAQLTSTPSKESTSSSPILESLISQPSKALNLSTTETPKPVLKVTPEVSKSVEVSSSIDKIPIPETVSVIEKPVETKTTTVEAPIQTIETVSSSLFGQNIFGQTAPTISTSSVFGSVVAAKTEVTTPTNVFGQTPQSAATVFGGTTGTTSIFGQPTSTPSVFGGGAVTASVFGTPTTASSVFGSPSNTTAAPLFAQTGSFGGQTTTTSIFGGSAATSPSVFGGSIATPTTSASVFGASAFGQPASTFGQTPVTTSAAPRAFGTNVFGQVASPPDSSSQVTSLFGGMMGGSSEGSMFGSSTFAAKSPGSIFGGQSPNTTDQSGNLFGSTEACSPFETKSAASKNLFGGVSAATANPFSQTPGSKPSAASIFGQSPSPSAFGSSGGSMFGQGVSPGPFSAGVAAGSSPFQQSGASVFGTPATPPAAGGSIFGGSSSFGSAAGSSPGGFGAPPTFGGAPAFGSTTFGGGNRSVFGSTSPTSSFGAPEQQSAPSAFPQSNTFTALASQNTVTFGNLAQQSPTAAPPSFGAFGAPQQQQANNNAPASQSSSFGGSSFSSWR